MVKVRRELTFVSNNRFFIIMLLLSIIFILSSINILAEEKLMFKTSTISFISTDLKYFFNIWASKKIIKDEIIYEIDLQIESKLFLNLSNAKFIIKTDIKEIKLNPIKKRYKKWFDKDKNLWIEQFNFSCKNKDFENYLQSSLSKLIIKTNDIIITADIPEEFKKYILDFLDYLKIAGLNVEEKYKPKIYLGFSQLSFPTVRIVNAVFSDYNILAGTDLYLLNSPVIFNLISNFFSFQITLPINFLFFSAINFSIFNLMYPFCYQDSSDLYLLNLSGIFAGITIKFFTLFKILTFSFSFLPGIFISALYDTNENLLYPVFNKDIIISMFGFQTNLNLDFKISENFMMSLVFNTCLNLYGTIYYSLDLQTKIGF